MRRPADVKAWQHKWWLSLPLFVLTMAVAAAIFNYEKSSGSVVAATLYSLRTSARARELLGDEIYFASSVPWINGPIDLVHGKVDIRFDVRGSHCPRATVRFTSSRPARGNMFETTEWSLTMADGTRVDLLEEEEGGQ